MKLERRAANGRTKVLAEKTPVFSPPPRGWEHISFADDDGYRYAAYLSPEEVKSFTLGMISAAINLAFATQGDRTAFEILDVLTQSGRTRPLELAQHAADGLSSGDKLELVRSITASLRTYAEKNREFSDYVATMTSGDGR